MRKILVALWLLILLGGTDMSPLWLSEYYLRGLSQFIDAYPRLYAVVLFSFIPISLALVASDRTDGRRPIPN